MLPVTPCIASSQCYLARLTGVARWLADYPDPKLAMHMHILKHHQMQSLKGAREEWLQF